MLLVIYNIRYILHTLSILILINTIKQNGTTSEKSKEFYAELPIEEMLLKSSSDTAIEGSS